MNIECKRYFIGFLVLLLVSCGGASDFDDGNVSEDKPATDTGSQDDQSDPDGDSDDNDPPVDEPDPDGSTDDNDPSVDEPDPDGGADDNDPPVDGPDTDGGTDDNDPPVDEPDTDGGTDDNDPPVDEPDTNGGADDNDPPVDEPDTDGDPDDNDSSGDEPTADAGDDQLISFFPDDSDHYRGYVALPSQHSADDLSTYHWTILSRPEGASDADILQEQKGGTLVYSLFATAPGIYLLELAVTNSQGNTATDELTITINAGPVAEIQSFEAVYLGDPAVLDASLSSDFDQDTLTYMWSLLSGPDTVDFSLLGGQASVSEFTPAVEGDYHVQLVVNDGYIDSEPVNFRFTAFPPINPLPFRIKDAEYNLTTDSIIAVSTHPARLYRIDPVTNTSTPLDLPLAPTSLSISPDGTHVAVGHDGWVSHIDLVSLSVEKTLPVTTDVLDIILAGNGYIYAFPRQDQWEKIRTIHIETGEEIENSHSLIRAGTIVKLHPSGLSIYGADNGLSPSDIEKYDISNGTAEYAYDSPYHGDFSMCGNLWLSKEGARIFTACGNVFRASDDRAEDMTYNGSLGETSWIKALDHSLATQKVAVIPRLRFSSGADDSVVHLYDYEFLTFDREETLPTFVSNGKGYQGEGRFVFFNRSGDKAFVIIQANENSGILNDYAITTVAP